MREVVKQLQIPFIYIKHIYSITFDTTYDRRILINLRLLIDILCALPSFYLYHSGQLPFFMLIARM